MINIIKFIIGWTSWIVIGIISILYSVIFWKGSDNMDISIIISQIYEDDMWKIMTFGKDK